MRSILALFVGLLLAAPFAAANWTYRGNNEPDTAFDDSTWMFFGPDTATSGRKIYFTAFAKMPSEGENNANVGILGTRIQPVETNIAAILGFWKDCNNDGYVGLIESAALEYRVELLASDSICPATAPVKTQAVYPHNDGTWVRELIWIGPTPQGGGLGSPNDNPTNFYSDGTAIWGDWGKPGASPTLICPGTGNAGLRSTGAILDSTDCVTYYRGVRTLNAVQAQTGLPVGGWEMRDIDNSPSPINVRNPAYPFLYGPAEPDGHPNEGDFRGYSGGIFGRDTDTSTRRERMVTLVDCENDRVAPSTDVNTPGNPLDPTTYPSLYESLNDTYEVAVQGPNGSNGQNACNPDGSGDQGLPYQAVHPEGYSEATFAEAGRAEVDHTFKFSPGSRNFPTAGVAGACRGTSPQFTRGPLGYCPPGDLGLNLYRHDGPIGPAWRTNFLINMYTMTIREQGLRTETPDFGGWYASFYAAIGPAAKGAGSVPSAVGGKYGSEACGDNESGIHNYWNCDPQAWLDRCADGETPTLAQHCYRVGFHYDMRDVDCWDGTLARGSGIRAGVSDLSPSGPCAPHPGNEEIDPPTV